MSKPSEPLRVFISYSWKDKGFVTGLSEHLRLLNVPIWFDQLELDSKGREYTEEELKSALSASLARCSSVVVLLNEYSAGSAWVAYEITTAKEIASQRPDFQIVGLVTEEPAGFVPTDILPDAKILDFSSGYKTAIADLGAVLTRELTVSSGYSVQAVLASATRNLRDGIGFSDHLKSLGVASARISQLAAARNALAPLEAQPRVTDVVGLADTLDSGRRFDLLVSGNLPLRVGEVGDGDAVAVSFLPTISAHAGRPPNMSERVDIVLVSIWPSSEQPSTANMSTLMAEYGQDGTCFLWLSHDACVHRYTMGSAEVTSVLLTEHRQMGDRECAIRWPNNNPDANLLYHRQALANKLGLGQVQQGQKFEEPRVLGVSGMSAYTLWMMLSQMEKNAPPALLTEPENWASDVWTSIITDRWQQPEVSQATALLGHLRMGGVLLFEVSARSSVSPILSKQMKQMVRCAGGHIFDLELGQGGKGRQHVCVSPRWVEMVRGYAES